MQGVTLRNLSQPAADPVAAAFEVQTVELNMGPQHPSTHGVLQVILKLEGERIIEAKPVMGYLHTGFEKLAEERTYTQCAPIFDRMDYLAAILNNLGYVGAVEKLLGIEIPKRAQYIRVIFGELQRVASHLFWLATHALDIGAMGMLFYGTRERELILDLFEMYTGARLLPNAFIIGGLRADLPPGFEHKLMQFLEEMPKRLDDYHTLLTGNRIWIERTQGVGVLSKEAAIALSMSGPMLRGSGVAFDVRRAMPYSSYEDFDFQIAVSDRGDTYGRYLVRMEEMRQSLRIIQQAWNKLQPGEIKATIGRNVKPPIGETYHTVESAKGQLGYYIVSDGSNQPYRCHVRGPSFVNLQALPFLAKGTLIADVVALIGTIDIVLGEVDR